MTELLKLPVFPMAFFVKLAPVSRTTLENWMRSGALVPELDEPGPASKEPSFGGKQFSIRNLYKVELMHRLVSTLGVSPRHASALSNRLIDDNAAEIDRSFRAAHQAFGAAPDDTTPIAADPPNHIFVTGDGSSAGDLACQQSGALALAVPIGVIARICYLSWRAYDLGVGPILDEWKQGETAT